jgi:S1-C subfamily serine protease
MRVENTPGSYGLFAGLFVFLLGLLVNVSCACAQHVTLKQVHDEYESAVKITATCVVVQDHTFSITGWGGSGVIVDKRRIVTAGHVAQSEANQMCSFVVTDYSGKDRLAAPLVIDETHDLASMVLGSDEPDFAAPYASFGGKPLLGSSVCASVAEPRRGRKCGEVQPYVDPPGDLVMDVVVEHGNSGSGLYDDRGALVGIVTHLVMCANGQYCAGKAATLEGHVKDLLP